MEDKKKKIRNEDTISVDSMNAEAMFRVDDLGSKTRNTYNGSFRVRCIMDPAKVMAAGRKMRQLLGPYGQSASDHEFNLAFALSQLEQRIITAPPWWDQSKTDVRGDGVADSNIIIGVLDLAIRAEELYNEEVAKSTEEIYNKLSEQIQEINKKKREEDKTLAEASKSKRK